MRWEEDRGEIGGRENCKPVTKGSQGKLLLAAASAAVCMCVGWPLIRGPRVNGVWVASGACATNGECHNNNTVRYGH